MPTFDIRCQAAADIVELWRIEADNADHARELFESDENPADFICQLGVDNERDRIITDVDQAEAVPSPQSAPDSYLERFPPEHRESADRAYQDGFADGANNAGEDSDLAALIEAATVARNEANARGDYAAPYVARLTAALEAFPAPWGEDSAPQSARAVLEADADAFEREGSLAQAAECRRAAEAASPDPEGQSARLPWFVCVSPEYYNDPCDTGYNWEGKADDRDDAVRQALIQCHIDNDRPYVGMPEDERTEDMEGSEDQPVDPDDISVSVHAAEPDFRAIGLAVHKGEPGALDMLRRALLTVHQI